MDFNAIPELTGLAHAHEDFSGNSPFINGAHVLPGGDWTIAGMFSQTAGLPLNIPVPRNDMDLQASFFPELLTLGGILEQQGYYQGLLVGSDAAFGGRELYYTTHGNFTIWDYYYAHDTGLIPYGHHVWWGFEDWRLFEIAKDKVTDMAAGDAPFHLSMLTVDTHRPHGWLCEYCPDYFEDQMANVFLCGSRQVYDFVNWIKEQDFFENTTIVIAGDHLTMDADFVEHVPDDYDRKTFLAIINSAVEVEDPTKHREFSTQDLFPTTLAAMGVNIPSNRLGLGTNLFSTAPTLIEQYGFELVASELGRGSDLMDNLVADFEYEDFEHVTQNPDFITFFPFNHETDTLSILVDESILEYLRTDEFIASARSQEFQNDMQFVQGVRRRGEGPILLNITIPAGLFWGSQIEIELIYLDLGGRQHVIYETQIVNPHINPSGVE
jgi:phosphoglycerol transferase